MFLFEVKSATKELSLRGQLTAKTKVRRALYDVIVGDVRFPSLLVSEPHVNSSVPQRALAIECGPSAFALEHDIRDRLKTSACVIAFQPIVNAERPGDRLGERFELAVSSCYAYVTLHGLLSERSPDHSDGLCWTSGKRTGCEEREPTVGHLAACDIVSPAELSQLQKDIASQEDVEASITIAGEAGQLRKHGDRCEMTFPGSSGLADSLAVLLTSGGRWVVMPGPFFIRKDGT